jgi:hypothetical protein
MKIKYSPCRANTETIIEKIDENTVRIDGEDYSFDAESILWDTITADTNYLIIDAHRIDGELWLTIRRFYTGACDWDTGDYHAA